MPSTSPEQKRLMAAVAHGWHKPGGGGPSVAVAKDFNKADQAMNKGYESKVAHFANGGEVLGRTRDFIKEPDVFSDRKFKKQPETRDVYGKGVDGARENAAPPAHGKALPAVKPKS